MAKKKLTAATKKEIESSWHELPYSQFEGEALKYLKSYKAKKMAGVAEKVAAAKKEIEKENRQFKYYTKNPLKIGKTKVLPGSSVYDEIMRYSKEFNKSPRKALSFLVSTGQLDYKNLSFRTSVNKMLPYIPKEGKIFINGSKVSRKEANRKISLLYLNLSQTGGFGAESVMKSNIKNEYFIVLPEELLEEDFNFADYEEEELLSNWADLDFTVIKSD